jgi:hypothetical protein
VNELPVHNFIFNIVAGIVQTFIKSWNQLLYPRVIEVCRLPFEPLHDFLNVALIQECGENPHVSSPVTMESRNPSPSCAYRARNFSEEVALRNHMTERTSHLAGLWIGAAI